MNRMWTQALDGILEALFRPPKLCDDAVPAPMGTPGGGTNSTMVGPYPMGWPGPYKKRKKRSEEISNTTMTYGPGASLANNNHKHGAKDSPKGGLRKKPAGLKGAIGKMSSLVNGN